MTVTIYVKLEVSIATLKASLDSMQKEATELRNDFNLQNESMQ